MLRTLRQFLLVLTAFAVFVGPMAQLAQSAPFGGPMTTDGMPCDMAMPMAGMVGADHSTPMMPCKGPTPDCIKQMGCVTDIALPVRVATSEIIVPFSMIDYWTLSSRLIGLASKPAHLPPRTIGIR